MIGVISFLISIYTLSAFSYMLCELCKKIKNGRIRNFLSKIFHQTILLKGLVNMFKWTLKFLEKISQNK